MAYQTTCYLFIGTPANRKCLWYHSLKVFRREIGLLYLIFHLRNNYLHCFRENILQEMIQYGILLASPPPWFPCTSVKDFSRKSRWSLFSEETTNLKKFCGKYFRTIVGNFWTLFLKSNFKQWSYFRSCLVFGNYISIIIFAVYKFNSRFYYFTLINNVLVPFLLFTWRTCQIPRATIIV